MIEVRSAIHSDLPVIQQRYASVLDQAMPTETLKRTMTRGTDLLLVATQRSKFCGFVHVVWSGGPCELLGLATEPSCRRQGIASLLMSKVFTRLTTQACSTLWLEVRADNNAAIALYLGTGAEVTGERKRYYRDGTDALLMSYTLGASD